MSDKHGPNSWEDYLAVHRSRISDFLGHFIVHDRLVHTETATQIYWDGALICADGIEIHVHKRQTVTMRRGRSWVQTRDYSYQVIRRVGSDHQTLFRYDNSGHHPHDDPHHRHRYDANGREINPPEHVGHDGWPTLGDVIEEAFDLWKTSIR